jgi:RHS repeat-associated protein
VSCQEILYDGDGNRVAKTVGTGASAITTKFLVASMSPTEYAQVVEEIVNGNVQRVNVHGHSLISQTQLINGNWTTSFYGFDGHGSVRFLTDLTGAITDTYTFDAFGNLIASTGSTPNNYLYAGERLDPNLGFYHLRARYLNSASGRFLTSDAFEGELQNPREHHL